MSVVLDAPQELLPTSTPEGKQAVMAWFKLVSERVTL